MVLLEITQKKREHCLCYDTYNALSPAQIHNRLPQTALIQTTKIQPFKADTRKNRQTCRPAYTRTLRFAQEIAHKTLFVQ